MRLYLAGPYSDPDPAVQKRNAERAMATGLALLKQGHAPFIPHLSHFFDQWATRTGHVVPYETYLAWDAAFLSVCEGLVWLGSSPGADRELELAARLGKPVISRLSGHLESRSESSFGWTRAVTPCHEMSHLSRP
jgi:hypothetical protein